MWHRPCFSSMDGGQMIHVIVDRRDLPQEKLQSRTGSARLNHVIISSRISGRYS